MSERLPERPTVPSDLRHWEGIGDPAYLLREIEELRAIADGSGLRTLGYILELACIEARREVVLKREAEEGSRRR